MKRDRIGWLESFSERQLVSSQCPGFLRPIEEWEKLEKFSSKDLYVGMFYGAVLTLEIICLVLMFIKIL